MAAREMGSPMRLALHTGQVQRVLVEAGSTIVVAQGALTLRFPFAWLAESVLARELPVRAEEVFRVAEGGWIDLLAVGRVEALILPPEGAGLWARVGRLLAAVRCADAATASAPPARQKHGFS